MPPEAVPPAITIRAAQTADAPALARLRYEFRAGEDPVVEPETDFLTRCTDWMAAQLAPGGSWRCWVADTGVALIGTAWLQLIEKLPNPVAEAERHGYISSVYVEPRWRGAGLGSRLLSAAVETCDREGVDAIILWPTERSRTLYQRHGFSVRDDHFERRGVHGA